MNLEVLAWAPRREVFLDMMSTMICPATGRPYATRQAAPKAASDVLTPNPGLNIDEIGEITLAGTPPTLLEGHHVNLRFHEPIAEALVDGLPQTSADGKPLGLFVRTHLLQWFPGSVWEDKTGNYRIQGPPGWRTPQNVKFYDPATVNPRVRIWA